MAAHTMLQAKSSLFSEISALFNITSSKYSMCKSSIDRLRGNFDEARDKLHLSLSEYDKEAARIAKVGLRWEWEAAKVLYDKLKVSESVSLESAGGGARTGTGLT